MIPDQASTASDLSLRIVERIDAIPASSWNALGVRAYPFLRHEFLTALENEGCLGERYGWLPRHITLWSGERLVGASPLYLKFNSYGEFVFDWSWADAYRRHGLDYYPKLVSASPYTPATGPKLLLHDEAPAHTATQLSVAALELARQSEVSSLHWLFTLAHENALLESAGLLRRTGCQFHWQNRGYPSFDAFLASLSAAKRKNIRRERRKVGEAGVRFRLLDGNSASDDDWTLFHGLYESTFDRRGGMPTLSLGFFRAIARSMPEAVLLIVAEQHASPVAAAFCLVGETTLYGRHWGCSRYVDNLHFETCYYQGIEYCIEHGLQRFEPGAQGEHKVPRGFLPTETLSAHWIADARFADAISRHLHFEREGMIDYMKEMAAHSPYRNEEAP
ncbi:MAG: N-acetyltransferase [Gammaproteobacteria bacterium]|nr:N-acetyltransferase [Gammaproteobacteria bacterium]